MRPWWAALLTIAVGAAGGQGLAAEPIKLLFLGDEGHHRPAERFAQLAPVLAARGIELVYTSSLADLSGSRLAGYQGLVIYANHPRITPAQEQALLDYVAGGKGLVALHCASYCFLNSPRYVELVGAQFQRHGTGTFRTILADVSHPILQGYGGFESWDETYVHTRHHEEGRVVLEYRQERDHREPWTWVRTHGQGRVFYTAWGHDQRTWSHPGFHNLVERGIRWVTGGDPAQAGPYPPAGKDGSAASDAGAAPQRGQAAASAVPVGPLAAGGSTLPPDYRPAMTPRRTDLAPLEYTEANIPFYPPGQRWGTNSTGLRPMQRPLPPEESQKHLVTPQGLVPKLFVSEPDLKGKPIFCTWDAAGRLWVCETYDYPNELMPPGEGRDRIRICEDADGDGRADRFTVFAEQLSIPTAIAFYRGGAIVQSGTQTLYLKDTDGDGRADLRKVLISGWNMRDTHGGVSNFRYGLDNWYWAMQGYNDSQPVLTDGRVGPRFRQGFFRFKVEGDGEQVAVTELEFLRSTNNNTWGLGFSEEGIVFGSTANGNPSEHLPIPNRYYEAVRGFGSSVLGGIADSYRFEPITDKVRQVDWHGGFTAAAGHALYTARRYPQEYWNRTAFVCEPTGHLIATFVLRPQGAGFRSRNQWNLVASDDEWTAPILAEVGPDGCVWFIDWYNYIVQHNPTPTGFRTGRGAAYETELRDKTHGRIYRLVWEGDGVSPPSPNVSLENAGPDALLAALRSDVMLVRLTAHRLLVERGNCDVASALIALVRDPAVDAIGLNAPAIHALWTLKGLGLLTGDPQDATARAALEAALAALKHPSWGVRRNAAQVLPPTEAVWKALQESGVLSDPQPQVRLHAILSLAQFAPRAEIQETAVRLLSDPQIQGDSILLDAVTAAAAAQEQGFLLAVCRSREARLTEPVAMQRLTILAEHVARGSQAEPAALVAALAQAPVPLASAIIQGLARGWPREGRPASLGDQEPSLIQLFERLPLSSKAQLATLAARWGARGLSEQIAALSRQLTETVHDASRADAERLAAAGQLVELQKNDGSVAGLLELITPRTSPELASGLVEALGRSDALAVGVALAGRLRSFTPAVRQAAIRVLLRKNEWTNSLLGAIQRGEVPLSDLALDQQQALLNHPDRQIAGRARRLLEAGGGLPDPDRQRVIDTLRPVIEQPGDAAAGKLVFKNQCAKCHTYQGEGTRIGPDLTGMAAHPKHELLVHLLDPSRSVEGNYRVYTVVTSEGQTITGLLASETKTTLELIDAEARKHAILREEIEALQASAKSLMPEGFEKQVKPEELRDLLEFLTHRGQYVPLPLEKVATIVSTRGMFYDENAAAERLVFPDWGLKTFAGVPFVLVDPQGTRVPNVILLYGPQGKFPPQMPGSVSLPCHLPAKAVHLLSGISGWGYPYGGERSKGSVSLIVRLHYADGQTEEHPLRNGEHFADYIRRVDVPGSQFAFDLAGRQVRYLVVPVERSEPLARIELVKGEDRTAPVVVAVTVETRAAEPVARPAGE